jgi:hypothetical protein
MNERLKQIIFKKLDQDLGQAEIIVDDNKSIWFIDRANKFWYLELRSSGTLWWRYSFFRDFFPLFGMERIEYEPVIAEWVEEVLKRGVSLTLSGFPLMDVGVEEVLKHEVFSTLQSKIDYQNQVEDVLKRGVSSTNPNAYLNNLPVEEVLKRGVSSTQRNHMNDCDEMEEALKRGVYSTQCNVGLQGSRPVEEVLKPKASPTTVDNLSAVVTMKKVLSLKAGVRECKMKIKKIFKKIIS